MEPTGHATSKAGMAPELVFKNFKFSYTYSLVPLFLMWTVWKERNGRTFKDLARSETLLVDYFASMLFDWSQAWGFSSSTSVIHFTSSLSLHTDVII